MVEFDYNAVYLQQGEWQQDVLDVVRRAARDFLLAGVRRVLDAGCGTGRHTYFLASQGFEVYGVDCSAEALRIAREKAPEAPNPTFGLGDLTDLSAIHSDSFDACLCIWSSGHGSAADLARLVQELLRVVRRNGIIYCDFMSVDDDLCGQGTEIEPYTYIGLKGEEAIPHHFSTREEVAELFIGVSHIDIEPIIYTHPDWGEMNIRAWLAIVRC